MMTWCPSDLAKLPPGQEVVGWFTYGHLVVEGRCLRLVDSDDPSFCIEVHDPEFLDFFDVENWPFRQSAGFLLEVDAEWFLSDLRITRVLEMSLEVRSFAKYSTVWPPCSGRRRDNSR